MAAGMLSDRGHLAKTGEKERQGTSPRSNDVSNFLATKLPTTLLCPTSRPLRRVLRRGEGTPGTGEARDPRAASPFVTDKGVDKT